jgi:hypothetical protein
LANIINGTDTGSGGLITTGDSSDELQLQTAEVARVTLTNTAAVVNESGADVDFRVEGDTDANLLFVDASTDRVGIGTGSPGSLFEIKAATPVMRINGTSGFRGIEFQSSGSTFGSLKLDSSSGETALSAGENSSGFFLTFKTGNGTERMRIDSSGNVLVGTTSGSSNIIGKNTGDTTSPVLTIGNNGDTFTGAAFFGINNVGYTSSNAAEVIAAYQAMQEANQGV